MRADRGTHVELFAQANPHLDDWFGHDRREVLDRLSVFARTGGDGSMAAFWLDDAGAQKIVHLGSGSGSTLVCVLADAPVDFLRLLAIGYDEICWETAFAVPPKAAFQREGFRPWFFAATWFDFVCRNEPPKGPAATNRAVVRSES